MKLGIASLYGHASYNNYHPGGVEIYYIIEMCKELGIEIHLLTRKHKDNSHLEFVRDYRSADFDSYDAIFLQLRKPQFFGGNPGRPRDVHFMENMMTSLGECSAKIYPLCNDPKIDISNPVEVLKRFDLCQVPGLLEKWQDIIDNSTYLFPGKDLNRFFGREVANQYKVDWFTYIFKHKLKSRLIEPTTPLFEFDKPIKNWDVCYFGYNRGGFREKQIVKYLPNNKSSLLIGVDSKKLDQVDFKEKMNQHKIYEHLDKCKVSLILGDAEHLDNVVTFRLYEILASNSLAGIQIEYDPKRELIKDPELRDLLYIESQKDVVRLVESYSDRLILLQKAELTRIFAEDKSLHQMKSLIYNEYK
jgi:hypothetical protein